MDAPLLLSDDSLRLAGILLLTIVTIELGGLYLVGVWHDRPRRTPFQVAFHRAGHAHAGVLVTLALVMQPYVDASGLDGVAREVARLGVPAAAILMPAGFFLSTWQHDAERPNALIWLTYVGAVSLAAGTLALGVGLVTT